MLSPPRQETPDLSLQTPTHSGWAPLALHDVGPRG